MLLRDIRNTVIFLFSIPLIFSCQEKKTARHQALPEIIIKEVRSSFENCNADSVSCTFVHIEYPEFTDSLKSPINDVIVRKVKNVASDYFREEVIDGPLEHMAASFIHDYEAFKEDFTEYTLGWYVEVISEITYESDRLISFRIESESFTGGAHPNASSSLFIIDKVTKKKLSTFDIISDTTRFKELLEIEFRKKKGMSSGQNFADRGFYINDGDFLLNENIGLSDQSIIVHFNPYEIAPYSEGATTLTLNKKDLGALLKIQ
ncbi:MAG: DUF3298 and DUF4163 domain-containing protein [Cytophagales bacterium]|nr:DUF3298 and DUF4163 domain-containing protein [Cytophagales bacterium]